MDFIEILRTVFVLLLLEYGTVSQHARHQDQTWQENLFLLWADRGYMNNAGHPTRWTFDLISLGDLTGKLNFDLMHLHSLPRWLTGFVMVFWTPQLSLWEGIVTTALLLPLSAIVWELVKKSAGKEEWGSFWSALFTGKR